MAPDSQHRTGATARRAGRNSKGTGETLSERLADATESERRAENADSND
jgi:hypothetical protein